jgi:hypothetical protein
MFLPATKDGPDVVFWVLCDGGQWYVVLIQAKYYKAKITGKATVSAVATVSKPLPKSVPQGVSTLRIFFPFMGATCESKHSLLENRVDAKGMYMYLDRENNGKSVLGADLCDTLYCLKRKRKRAPN